MSAIDEAMRNASNAFCEAWKRPRRGGRTYYMAWLDDQLRVILPLGGKPHDVARRAAALFTGWDEIGIAADQLSWLAAWLRQKAKAQP